MGDIRFLSIASNGIHTADVAGAVTLFCDILDVPAFDPEQTLSPSQRSARGLVLLALVSISSIPNHALCDSQSPAFATFQVTWPNILKWLRYFCCVVTAAAPTSTSSESKSLDSDVPRDTILFVLNSFVLRTARDCKLLYETSIATGGLLDLIVKAWLKTADRDPSGAFTSNLPTYSTCWLIHLHNGLSIVDTAAVFEERDVAMKWLDETRRMVLREADGDAGMVAMRLLCLLKYPAKADKDRVRLFDKSLSVISSLFVKDMMKIHGEPTEFMDAFLKNGVVPLAMQLLSFAIEDISLPCEHRLLTMHGYCGVVQISTLLLHKCQQSMNGVHWTAAMLKLGLLRIVTRLLLFPIYLGPHGIKVLQLMLGQNIPNYFCHRAVVTAAINATKEIVIDGMVKKIRSSPLKKAWRRFESVLLDRTVLNAIYERDFAEIEVARCSVVRPSGCYFTVSRKIGIC